MLVLKYKWLSGLFLVLAAIYLTVSILTPPDKAVLEKYDITAGQVVALLLAIAIPYLVIWCIALVGYLRLRDYTATIVRSPDGEAFAKISQGVLLLALWLPVSAVMSSLGAYYYHMHPEATASMVRLDNYASLVILLPAFLLINVGAQKLLVLVKRPLLRLPQRIILTYLAFAAVYVFLTFQDPARQAPTDAVAVGTYYLPDWATLLTLVIPRLVMWFLGIQAVYYLHLYSQKIKGSLYKDALRNLTRGLGWMVVAIVILRCFQSLSSLIADFGLGLLLLLIYVLLIVISIGYVWIAKGAKKLQKIEEV